mgnify:CR=1 FL=1
MGMKNKRLLENFYNRHVFITGHTGFKGSWMCQVLLQAGAKVTGYALEPPTEPSLFVLCGLDKKINSIMGDIRDLKHLKEAMEKARPDIVIHMAAQPIVRDSYNDPVYTFETNVMGTVNVLEAIRHCGTVRSVVNVTTDKVYRNNEWCWGYREDDVLDGHDPYSNSKSCSELVAGSYIRSFFRERDIAVSDCRAGNVIGGGDFAKDRIIPDCIRAVEKGETIVVRNPNSVRPYQHVLEAVMAYLMVIEKQWNNTSLAGSYNIGPKAEDCRKTEEIVTLFCNEWNRVSGKNVFWEKVGDKGPYEANFLKLDCSKIQSVFGWKPRWGVETAVEKIVEWTREYFAKEDVVGCMEKQIEEYISG